MFSLREPSRNDVLALLDRCADAPFSYDAVGATRGAPPAGFDVDRWAEPLGVGRDAWQRARRAIDAFEMYPAGWITVVRSFEAPAEGAVFASVIRHAGFYSVNVGRVIYVVDEEDDAGARYGFAFGTLPEHAEAGEERFVVAWSRATDEVTYDVFAFSRPRALLARLGKPIARAYQKRFQRESRAWMRERVARVEGSR